MKTVGLTQLVGFTAGYCCMISELGQVGRLVGGN